MPEPVTRHWPAAFGFDQATATLHAQDKPKAPLTNEDVVAMVNGGLDEGLILQPMTSTSTSLLADCSG